MEIKVLGGGCANCHKLEQECRQVVQKMGLEATIEMISDIKTIMAYGVMSTPALVVDGKVVISGRVPAEAELTRLLTSALVD